MGLGGAAAANLGKAGWPLKTVPLNSEVSDFEEEECWRDGREVVEQESVKAGGVVAVQRRLHHHVILKGPAAAARE